MTSGVPGPGKPGGGRGCLPRRPGDGGRARAVGVRHRHLPGGQGAADQAGAGQPDGRASRSPWTTAPQITFTGFNEWVSLQTSFDPAQVWALVFAVILLVGLMVSLVFKRRRVWFRLHPGSGHRRTTRPARTVPWCEVGGLARTDQAGYGEEFASLADACRSRETVTVPPMAGTAGRRRMGEREMNETWAQISDLAFEAALAGYVVALVCYAIELASASGRRRRRRPPRPGRPGDSARGGTSTLTRTGGAGRADRDQIGALARPHGPWGVRFGRAAVVVTVVGAAANVLSVVARGLAVGRLPLGNMYEFVSVICAVDHDLLADRAGQDGRPHARHLRDAAGGDPRAGCRHPALCSGRAGGAGAELVLEVDPRHHDRHLQQHPAGQRRGVGALSDPGSTRAQAGRRQAGCGDDRSTASGDQRLGSGRCWPAAVDWPRWIGSPTGPPSSASRSSPSR